MKKHILMLMSVALFVCCSDDKNSEVIENQRISLSAESVEFDGNGHVLTGTNSITVTSSAEWRVVGDTSWCTPSVEKGGNGTTVSFNVSASDTDETRSVNLIFICGDAAEKLTIRQVPNPTLELIKVDNPYTIAAAGSGFLVKYSSNLENIDCGISEDWVKLTYASKGNESAEKWLQFTVDANKTFYAREATITLFKGTSVETTVAVEQTRYVGVLIQSGAELAFGVDGGTATVTAIGNVNFNPSVASGNSSWLSAVENSSEGTDIITKTFTVTCASSLYIRTGTVTLTPTSGTSATVNVTQTNPDQEWFSVPDSYFSERLVSLGYIIGKDGLYGLTYSGSLATSITHSYYYYTESVVGIEKFENLTTFSSTYSSVKLFDFSKNTKLTSLTLNYIPVEVLILGDVNITTRTMNSLYNTSAGVYAESFTISSSKLTSLTVNHTASTSYDKVEWIDITGCPVLTLLSCNRNSGNLKEIRVTQAQKDAYSTGALTITTNANFSGEIVVK